MAVPLSFHLSPHVLNQIAPGADGEAGDVHNPPCLFQCRRPGRGGLRRSELCPAGRQPGRASAIASQTSRPSYSIYLSKWFPGSGRSIFWRMQTIPPRPSSSETSRKRSVRGRSHSRAQNASNEPEIDEVCAAMLRIHGRRADCRVGSAALRLRPRLPAAFSTSNLIPIARAG